MNYAGNASGWVHIFMEIKYRELDSRLLLACQLAARGHNVVIGPYSSLRKRLERLPKGVIFDKSLHDFRKDDFLKYRAMGHRITVSDEESQSIYTPLSEKYLRARLSDRLMEITDKYFVWGEVQKQILNRKFGRFEQKFIVSGSPRTDVWRSPYNGYYDKKVEDIRKRFGRYILVPSNFGLAMNKSSKEHLIEQAVKLGQADTKEELDRWKGHIKYHEIVVSKYREAIIEIGRRFPDHKVILRPHPADSVEKWKTLLAGIDHCHVVMEGAAGPWLKAAEAIFHNGCTTSLEAFFMDTFTITYSPCNWPEYDEPLLKKTGPVTEKLDELLESLEGAINGKYQSDEFVASDLDQYFYWREGRYCVETITDHISQVIEGDPLLSGPQTLGNYEGGPITRLRTWWRNTKRPLNPQKWPSGLSDDEVQDRVKFYCSVNEDFGNVAATRLSKDGIFWVRKI